MGKGKFNHLSSSKKLIQIVNLSDLSRLNQSDVDKNILHENGLIKNINLPVKILANGDIEQMINVSADFFSAMAKEKIEKLGGKAISL